MYLVSCYRGIVLLLFITIVLVTHGIFLLHPRYSEPGSFGAVRDPCAGAPEDCVTKFATPEMMPEIVSKMEAAGEEIPTDTIR